MVAGVSPVEVDAVAPSGTVAAPQHSPVRRREHRALVPRSHWVSERVRSAVREACGSRVSDLEVEVSSSAADVAFGTVIVRGVARSYHVKQIATKVAMRTVAESRRLTVQNEIVVR